MLKATDLCPELCEVLAAPGRSQSAAKQLTRLWLDSGPARRSIPEGSRDLCLDLGCLEPGLCWVPGVALDGIMRCVVLG